MRSTAKVYDIDRYLEKVEVPVVGQVKPKPGDIIKFEGVEYTAVKNPFEPVRFHICRGVNIRCVRDCYLFDVIKNTCMCKWVSCIKVTYNKI